MRKLLPYLLGAACVFSAIGCGGSAETVLGTERNPRVRVLNLVSNPSTVDISLNGEVVGDNSQFGTLSTYRIYTNGNRETIVRDAVSQGELARSTNLYELSNYYTTVVYNGTEGVQIARVREDRDVREGRAQLRFIHLANSVGPVDVYVTAPGTDLTGVTPTESNVPFGTSSTDLEEYLDLEPGNYQVRVTAAGTQNVILTEDVNLVAGASRTVYAVSNGTPDLLEVNDKE
jgi:hypothetical protein